MSLISSSPRKKTSGENILRIWTRTSPWMVKLTDYSPWLPSMSRLIRNLLTKSRSISIRMNRREKSSTEDKPWLKSLKAQEGRLLWLLSQSSTSSAETKCNNVTLFFFTLIFINNKFLQIHWKTLKNLQEMYQPKLICKEKIKRKKTNLNQTPKSLG